MVEFVKVGEGLTANPEPSFEDSFQGRCRDCTAKPKGKRQSRPQTERAVKTVVVCIIFWSWVRIPQGLPIFRRITMPIEILESKITVCPKCDGSERITVDKGTTREELVNIRCPSCQGSGRVIIETRQLPYAKKQVRTKKKINAV